MGRWLVVFCHRVGDESPSPAAGDNVLTSVQLRLSLVCRCLAASRGIDQSYCLLEDGPTIER